MKEKSYYTDLNKFYVARARFLQRSVVWEAKFTRTDSIPFSDLQPHQEEKMLEAERVYGYKIADIGRIKKPFDGIAVYGAAAFVVVIFYKPNATAIYEIDIRTFIHEREHSKRKSLTHERARDIGTWIRI